MRIISKEIYIQQVAKAHYCIIARLAEQINSINLQPEDMPDAEEFDEDDNLEEGLTELDRQRHRSVEDDMDLIEDEDDSFVDELDEEE